MSAQEKAEQLDELRSRKDDWSDVNASTEKQTKAERVSLSARLDQWRCQKEAAVCETDQQKEAVRIELELRAQEAADVADYKASMRSSRRDRYSYYLHANHLRAPQLHPPSNTLPHPPTLYMSYSAWRVDWSRPRPMVIGSGDR